jgi:hypothetical protein
VIQVRNQIVQKWIVQRNSPILFLRFRGMIDSCLDILSDTPRI